MPAPSLKHDPRGYGAVPAAQIIATVPRSRLGWALCNRRLHVVREIAALNAELVLIDAAQAESDARVDRALADCLASMRRAS